MGFGAPVDLCVSTYSKPVHHSDVCITLSTKTTLCPSPAFTVSVLSNVLHCVSHLKLTVFHHLQECVTKSWCGKSKDVSSFILWLDFFPLSLSPSLAHWMYSSSNNKIHLTLIGKLHHQILLLVLENRNRSDLLEQGRKKSIKTAEEES